MLARHVEHRRVQVPDDLVGIVELGVSRQVADVAGVDVEGRLLRHGLDRGDGLLQRPERVGIGGLVEADMAVAELQEGEALRTLRASRPGRGSWSAGRRQTGSRARLCPPRACIPARRACSCHRHGHRLGSASPFSFEASGFGRGDRCGSRLFPRGARFASSGPTRRDHVAADRAPASMRRTTSSDVMRSSSPWRGLWRHRPDCGCSARAD